MMQWLAIALGGALGSVARFAAVGYLTPLLNFKFPIGTFVVNILGSFLIGIAYIFTRHTYHATGNIKWVTPTIQHSR